MWRVCDGTMAGDLFAQSGGNALILGVGSAGCRIAGAGALEDAANEPPQRAAWGAAHSRRAELIATGLERKLLIEIAPGPFAARSAAHGIAARQAELAAACAGRPAALLVGVADESIAGVLLPALAAALRRSLFVSVIAAGTSGAVRQLQGAADLLVHLVAEEAPADTPFAALRARTERMLLGAVQTLAAMLPASADSGFTPAELRSVLRGSEPLRGRLYAASGPDAAVLAVEAALTEAEKFRAEADGAAGISAAVLTGREPSAASARCLTRTLQGLSSGSARLFGLCTQPAMGEEAFCLALTRPAGSGNVVALEAAARGDACHS